jgi:PST family polysaccharide transporter
MLDTVAAEKAVRIDSTARPLRPGVARAALASGAVETVSRVLTIVLSIATARALEPREVGLLGLAVIVTGIVSLVAACSETAGVITRGPGSDREHAVVATAIRGVVAIVLVTATYLCLSLISHVLAAAEASESQLNALIRLLLLLPLIEAAGNYPRVVLQRRLDLSFMAGLGLVQIVIHVGMSISLLWLGYGAAGVVCSSLIAASVAVLLFWLRVLVRSSEGALRPHALRSLFGEMLKNNGKVFTGSFIGYLNGRIDNILVASAIGPTAMSFYSMSWSASRTPAQILGQALGFVLVPTIARISDDQERIQRGIAESLRHSYTLLAPVCAMLFLGGPAIVLVILGSKWLPMVPALRIMSLTVLTAPIIVISTSILVGTGRAHLTGLATLGQLLALGAITMPLCRAWGITGAAFGDMLATFVSAIALLAASPLMRQAVQRTFLQAVLLPIAAVVMSGILAVAVSSQLQMDNNSPVELLILAVAYPLFLSILGGKTALWDLLNILRTGARQLPVASNLDSQV